MLSQNCLQLGQDRWEFIFFHVYVTIDGRPRLIKVTAAVFKGAGARAIYSPLSSQLGGHGLYCGVSCTALVSTLLKVGL